MEPLASINPVAILAAGIVSFVLGFAWYSSLFQKPWLAALGLRTEDVQTSGISTARAAAGSLAASLATALALALLFALCRIDDMGAGMFIALTVWIGFSLTPMFKMMLWEDRPASLFLIDGGYEFASIFSSAAVLLIWH